MASKKIIFTSLLVGVGVLFWKSFFSQSEECIGILQTASHPALDLAREEFVRELKSLNSEIKVVVQNAQCSVAQAQSIAALFHSQKKIKAIYAIGTLAVQAAARTEKEKPVIFSAVTGPQSLDLGINVCGITDRVNTDRQADWIAQMGIKKVAILHNPSEMNSEILVKKMRSSLQNVAIESILIGTHSESELIQAASAAARKGEAILLPPDNLCALTLPAIIREAKQTPVIASDVTLVPLGASAALGVDYGFLGKRSAQITHRLLSGEKPEEIGFEDPAEMQIAILKEPKQ